MWSVYLIGGLAVMATLIVALPLLIMSGFSAWVELMRGAEVEDDET